MQEGMKAHVTLGLSFCFGVFACLIDFDHIPLWIFNSKPAWIFQSVIWEITSSGRPLHSLYFWIPISIILSGVLSSFLVRYLQPTIHNRSVVTNARHKHL